jgi:hypothetical protein
MTKTITISDSDLEALRRIRNLDDHGAHAVVLDRILAAAERPGPGAIAMGAVHRGREDRGAEWVCPACGDPCTCDFARLVWNCHGCLATFTDERRLRARSARGRSAGGSSGGSDPLHAVESVPADVEALAIAVELHVLPKGGRVVFTFRDGERTVYLPGRRFQLVSALLAPPAPRVAGELVPNADLIEQVWDDDPALGSRQDLNVLLTRCRQDLDAAGIAAALLIERAPGGGATRARLAPGAQVSVAAG